MPIVHDLYNQRAWRIDGDTITPADLAQSPDLICGAGTKTQPVPCPPPDAAQGSIMGLSQSNPRDTAHGPETAVRGYLHLYPKFDGVLCISGPRTHWMHISAGEVVSFRSFMTRSLAEPFELHTNDGFETAVTDALSRPQNIAADVAHGPCPIGSLIGAELAAARPWWLGQDVVCIGDWADIYGRALGAAHAMARVDISCDYFALGLMNAIVTGS